MNMYLTQFQTSVHLDFSKLSVDQIYLRSQEIKKQTINKTCSCCFITKPLSDFRKRTKRRGKIGIWYDAKCKDCHARVRGTKEIGKLRFAKHLLEKGFRRCTECKDIKPINEFYGNKANCTGISNTCKNCSSLINHHKYHSSKRKITS